jgi:hypothetical protein
VAVCLLTLYAADAWATAPNMHARIVTMAIASIPGFLAVEKSKSHPFGEL